jgi:FKBP-type peptidyl-prolyl cis-trans isomerase FkpA
MKPPRPSPPPPPRASKIFPVLLALSLAGNAIIAWLAFHLSHATTTTTVTLPVAVAPAVVPPARFTGELAAYAALGSAIAENNHIPDLKWRDDQLSAFLQGIRASHEGHGYPVDDNTRQLRDAISARVQAMAPAAPTSDPIEEYFQKLRETENVQRTASGLHYRITEEGFGNAPTDDATVVISYAARLPDGESLPALSRARVRTAMADLLPGMREGLLLLHRGGKALIYLPPALSFGNGAWPAGVPRGAPVIFFLEVHDIAPAK